MITTRVQFYTGIYQEHLIETGSIFTLIHDYFLDSYLPWSETRELQQRIAAHVDALELGEQLARKCSIEFLESDDEDELLGAAYSLATIFIDDAGLEIAIEVFSNEEDEDRLGLFVAAFKSGKHPKLSKKLFPLLQHDNPIIRAATAEILGYRGDADPRRIWPLFHDSDETVKTAAMVAVMRLGFKEAVSAMEQAVLRSKETFNEHCLLPLLVLGSKKALHFVQRAMISPEFIKEQYPIYLAFAGNQQDYPLFAQALKFEGMLLPVVEALGIYGNVQSVNFLLKQLAINDDELKLETAKSLNMITGANLKETAIVVEQEEPDLDAADITGKVDDKKDEQQQGDSREIEIQQDCTDHQTWSNWWQNNMARFNPSQRYRYGKPYTFYLVLEEIAHPRSCYNDRQRAYYELVIRSGEHIPFEPDWFVDKQIEALKKWQTWWNRNKTKLSNQWMFDGS